MAHRWSAANSYPALSDTGMNVRPHGEEVTAGSRYRDIQYSTTDTCWVRPCATAQTASTPGRHSHSRTQKGPIAEQDGSATLSRSTRASVAGPWQTNADQERGGVIERIPCSIKMLPTTKGAASFHDFEEYERLVEAARTDLQTYLVVLLGGEAGMRCGEIMALEWTDVDLNTQQLCVARSEWKGHVTVPKGGRLRYVPLTKRLTEALRQARHLRGPRVLCDAQGHRSRRRWFR